MVVADYIETSIEELGLTPATPEEIRKAIKESKIVGEV